jgi:hypothetical protein
MSRSFAARTWFGVTLIVTIVDTSSVGLDAAHFAMTPHVNSM